MAKTKASQVENGKGRKVIKDKGTKHKPEKPKTKASKDLKRKADNQDGKASKKAKTAQSKENEKSKLKKEKKDKQEKKEPAPKKAKAKAEKVEKPAEPKKPEVEQKDDSKAAAPARRVSGKSRPADENGIVTPPAHKRAVVSPSVDSTPSTCTSLVSLENIAQWKKEAEAKGISLEDHMEEVSRKALEDTLEVQMKEMAASEQSQLKESFGSEAEDEGKEKKKAEEVEETALVPSSGKPGDSSSESSAEAEGSEDESSSSSSDHDLQVSSNEDVEDEGQESEEEDDDDDDDGDDEDIDEAVEKTFGKEEGEEGEKKDSSDAPKRPSALRAKIADKPNVITEEKSGAKAATDAVALAPVVETQRAATNFEGANRNLAALIHFQLENMISYCRRIVVCINQR